MASIPRRAALKMGAMAVSSLLPPLGRIEAQDPDAVQRWIWGNALRIDPEVDLGVNHQNAAALVEAVGNSRIVMLGEPSHGAGGAFSAKVRLVRFLHERMGFEVLVWESGLIDLERTEAGLRGDLDPVEAAQRGILKIWSASAECRPLFQYARASHRGARPLVMAGFDMQLTAAGTWDYFAAQLRSFVDTPELSRGGAKQLSETVIDSFGRLNQYTDALAATITRLGRAGVSGTAQSAAIQTWNKSEGDALRPTWEDADALEKAATSLTKLLSKSNANGSGFMVRAVDSVANYGRNLFESQGQHSQQESERYAITTENRRDRVNAENLKWWIESRYAGKKMIVWAHNAHVMNAWYANGFGHVSLAPAEDGMQPMGVWLTEWFGDAVYKVGTTTYQGSDGWVGAVPAPVVPATTGSLEERLHRLGAAEAFLPLRGRTGWRPQFSPAVNMRIPKYQSQAVENPAQPFDAIYYIDDMRPATAI